ncbi:MULTISPECIES: FecR family protein [Sphingobacterium]|uniref:FecR family protein n=1 Tax=Sphingobacterium TaxID=28453 RepID=UPI0008A47479|nr:MULTISPECIES: FecR domain-containing protein [Sphingobacterium]OFV14241.1 hypothetical protein HMPREF3127_13805 [Sphingobacterium sp. HMSC13C05]HAL50932.1 FecR family protein [Sphingobacterium sp.]
MNEKNDHDIWQRYREGRCSEAEIRQLEDWYTDWNTADRVFLTEAQLQEAEHWMRMDVMRRTGLARDNLFIRRIWTRVAVGAAAAVAMAFGIWLYRDMTRPNTPYQANTLLIKNDIPPGKNAATITLDNGQVVTLNSNKTAVVIESSQLQYDDGTAIKQESMRQDAPDVLSKMYTVETPRGGQYQIVLSDGTKAWLNAASSIRFPRSFAGAKNRRIEISGEVYLEVSKDEAHPFIVRTATQEIKVLGTHFNVNDYADGSPARTTLLEGLVQVSSSQTGSINLEYRTLKPGQQAVISDQKIAVRNANLSGVVAWKDGDFRFENENVTEIMKQIARWYDVEIIYKDNVNDVKLNAAIARNRKLSQVLNMMEKTGEVKFKLEGRKIIVTK